MCQTSRTDLNKIYVVVQGREPGIYSSWKECELQVKNFRQCRFKKFTNKEDALLYLDKSINVIETLCPKKKKSVEQLKNILKLYREKWKNDRLIKFSDVEATQCKSFEDSKTKIINSSRFRVIYNDKSFSNKEDEYKSGDAVEIFGNSDLVCSLEKNASDNSFELGVSSFHLERERECESNFFTNSENEKHDDFYAIYNGISYNNEKYEIRDELYFCKNMSSYLEENVTDNNTEIYEVFRSLGSVQQAECERIYESQSSEACGNFQKEKKVLNYLDFSNILSNACNNAPDVCTRTPQFSEKNMTNNDEEFSPYLFDLEKNRQIEESCTCPEDGESVVNGYLELYTDGACYNNGKENAYGAVGIYFGRGSKLNMSLMLEGKVTNNIAEIRAAHLGLQKAYENGFTKVRLYTDSDYVVKCFNRWLQGWKRNKWKRPNGLPVLNQQELQDLDEAISKMEDVKLLDGCFRS